MTTIYNINKDIYNSFDSEAKKSNKTLKFFEKIHEYNAENEFVDFNSKTDRFGSVVALSGDGNTIAVSAPYYSTYINGKVDKLMCGIVIAYTWNVNRWDQKGNQIIGKESYFKLGISMDISYNGSKIIIGSAYNPLGVFLKVDTMVALDEGITATGFISQITDKFFNEWTANPSNDPNNYEEEYGVTSEDTYSFQPEETSKQNLNAPWVGNVTVYEYEAGNYIWMTIFDKNGDKNAEECFGYTVSISINGDRIIIGSPTYSVTARYKFYVLKRLVQIAFENFPFSGKAFEAFDILSQMQDYIGILEAMSDVSDFYKKAQANEKAGEAMDDIGNPVDWVMRRFIRYATKKNIGIVQVYELENSQYVLRSPELQPGYFYISQYRKYNISGKDIGEAIADGLIDSALVLNMGTAYLLTDPSVHVGSSNYGIHNDQSAFNNLTPNAEIYELNSFSRLARLASYNDTLRYVGLLDETDEDGFIGSVMAATRACEKIVSLSKSNGIIKTYIFENKIARIRKHLKEIVTVNEIEFTINPDLELKNITLSISGRGNLMAVGSPYSDCVKIYGWSYEEGRWHQYRENNLVDDFKGAHNTLYGSSVSINYDGTIIAISAPNSHYGLELRDESEGIVSSDTVESAGMVRVYKLNSENEWHLMGTPIYGNKNNLLGVSIKLSDNGQTLVIGVPCKHIEHNEAYVKGEYGFARVFRFIDGKWNQNCFNNGQSSIIQTKKVIPIIPPVIQPTINGNKILNLFIGINFQDPGINLTSSNSVLVNIISDVNINKIGYYNLAYITQLPNGHKSYWCRDVNVIMYPAFRSLSPIIIYQDDVFDINDGGYGLIMDETVCEIFSRVHNVNTAEIGDEYSITLEVHINVNPYNNRTIKCTRPVSVVSKNIITINGGKQFVKQFNKYNDFGATIKTRRGDKLSNSLITTNIPFNTEVIGRYNVTYSAQYADDIVRNIIVTSPYIKSYEQILHEIN